MRQYFARRYPPVRVAASADSTSALRSHGLPLPVEPLLRFPADSLLPGESFAQEARWRLDGNTLMSTPISATITSALRRPTPGIESSSTSADAKGAICSSIRAEQAPI